MFARFCSQYFSSLGTYSLSYSPALNRQAMAAAVIAGRPPPPLELYCTPPSGSVQSRMYLTALSMISLGTGMPALRQPRRPCTCVIVVEPSSKPPPSFALT